MPPPLASRLEAQRSGSRPPLWITPGVTGEVTPRGGEILRVAQNDIRGDGRSHVFTKRESNEVSRVLGRKTETADMEFGRLARTNGMEQASSDAGAKLATTTHGGCQGLYIMLLVDFESQ